MSLPWRRPDPRPPQPECPFPGCSVRWHKTARAWQTTAQQPSGTYTWNYHPDSHTWNRGDRHQALGGSTRSETWANRQAELLREQNRLIEEQNRLLAGLPPAPPEVTTVTAAAPPPDRH